MILPYATPEFPGIGGSLKQRPQDFFVEELPLYEPSGEGEHVYCQIEKTGIPTFAAVKQIAGSLGISTRDIGYAGLKDAQSVSRQVFSIWGVTPEQVAALQLPNITIQWVVRHGNKLRLGHLRGNRFAIKIRDVSPTDVVKLAPVVQRIQQYGMPNYFGEQRFGRRGDNDQLGAALLRADNKLVLSLLLGTPRPDLDDDAAGARALFDAGDYERAMKLYPRHCGLERRILARFIKVGKPGPAVAAVEEQLRRLWISALQSALFNEVVAARINSLDKLLPGDLAEKHDNGAVFLVEDAAVEQPRADRFEISPTGPLVGYRMTLPGGEALRLEQEVFAARNIVPGEFRDPGRLKVKGARRSMRVKVTDLDLAGGGDEHGPFIAAAFTLPAGSFATVLLRELMKPVDTSGSDDEPPADSQVPANGPT